MESGKKTKGVGREEGGESVCAKLQYVQRFGPDRPGTITVILRTGGTRPGEERLGEAGKGVGSTMGVLGGGRRHGEA